MLNNICFVGLMLFAACQASAQLQVSADKVYPADQVQFFVKSNYEESITRQNSCTLTLSDFYFSDAKNGAFLVRISVAFQSIIGANPPTTIAEVQMLADDVIQNVAKDTKYSISEKRLGANIPLSDVNNIHVEVSLVRAKDNYKDGLTLLKPILGQSIVSNSVFQVVDNILATIKDPASSNQLLFQADFSVPLNVFEYKKLLSNQDNILQVSNNQVYAIVLDGAAKVPDESLKGKVASGVNSLTRFVAGRNVIKSDVAKYSGLARLYFTKDTNPILPISLQNAMSALESLLNSPLSNVTQENFNVNVDSITRLTGAFSESKQIDIQTRFSIQEYLKLASIFFASKKADRLDTTWIDSFIDWSNTFDVQGATVGGQAIGITKIYDSTMMAKVYIPYSLSDASIIQFYLWQVSLHRALKAHMRSDLAVSQPPKP